MTWSTGKVAVRTGAAGEFDRGLVVRLASVSPFAIPKATTVFVSSVADSATDVQLIANPGSASQQMKWSIANDSTADLYVRVGGGIASLTAYTVRIPTNGYFESVNDLSVLTEVRGIWASDPNTGAARITVYSP